jgi:type I restriction enzyme, S subunit
MPELATRRSKAGWTTVAFGDVVRKVTDKVDPEESGLERYIAGEHMETDDLRLRRWGEIGDGYLGPAFHMRFKPGHVLYGSRRTYLRKVAVADFEGITANTTYVLESADPKVLLPELLPFIMQTEAFSQHSVRESKGSVNPYVNFSDLAWFEFALPPIEEQRRMAEALVATEKALEKLRLLAESAGRTASALLEVRLQKLERTTPLTPLGDLLVDGPRNGLSPKVNSEQRGFRTVSIGAVSHGRFVPDEHVKYVDLTPDEAAPYLVKEGDIFAVRGNGNRQLVARVGRSEHSYEDLVYPDLLIRMRFDPDRVAHGFLVAQWNHPSVHARLLSRSKSSNGISKVNGQDIRAHELLVPPLAKQEEISASLSQFTLACFEAERRMSLLRQIKSGILTAMQGGSNE